MKKLILALLIPFIGFSQTKISSKIVSVTVYKSGAQITREAIADLKNGENNLVIKGVSPELDKNSIQVKFMDATISLNSLSHQLSLNNEEDYVQMNAKIIKSNNAINEEKKRLKIEQTLLDYQEKMLLSNQNVGGTYSGMKPEDLTKTVDYFDAKMKKVLNAKYNANRKLDSLEIEIKENNRKLNDLGQNNENKLSEIVINLKAKQNKSQTKIIVTYFLQNAGWSPSYDFNALSLDKPLNVLYKAKVYQYSGEDWKDVKVTLSNSLPKKNSTIPELKMWIWGIPNDYSQYTGEIKTSQKLSEIWGVVKDEEGNPLPGAVIQLKGTSLGTSTNINGSYRITIPSDKIGLRNELQFSFVGYISQSIKADNSPINVILKEDSQLLQEVVVTGYGTSIKKNATGSVTVVSGRSAGVQVTRSLIEEKEKPASLEFTLNDVLTLNSDGKEKTLDLKELEIPVEYLYKSTPKIDPAAFLTAQIMDWEQFNFIDGEANLYFEGTFLGKSALDLSNKDTLNLSLGRDQSIKVERKQLKKYSKKQSFGQNIQSQYVFDISVRNTKNQDIRIIVEDQFPITANKDVDISDKEAPESKIDKDSGIIRWDINLKKSSEKILKLSYAVKYPKNLMVEEE
ncbi:mucoidy inhibitor MuiA family protein [Lacihabitans sp. CCS-44]|uniref:DUF4139 domain-containing protein n=1 Tax=Lacihabitans sp. CCS-44 TaxID=2487331 RepID=UPI0020CC9DAC|nr:DUF4139 domain-containing protein [Lacihabitans sp. CCS-44]MCP9754718.1 mucoidy inhibitor MuiA family protein [Lacihabitans sp. CCS-44]